MSARTADAFVPEEDWSRLPLAIRLSFRAMLWVPALRKMGKLPHYRFGA